MVLPGELGGARRPTPTPPTRGRGFNLSNDRTVNAKAFTVRSFRWFGIGLEQVVKDSKVWDWGYGLKYEPGKRTTQSSQRV